MEPHGLMGHPVVSFWAVLLTISTFYACAKGVYLKLDHAVDPLEIIQTALSFKGTPYRYGGTTPEGFDCAAFLVYVFSKHGIHIPRTTAQQARLGKKVSCTHLVPGDLVFFHTLGIFPKATHVGLYIGNGQFVHAGTSPPAEVRIESLHSSYYNPRFLYGRRILP